MAAALLLAGAGACKKASRLTQFDMKYNASVVVESGTGINLPFNILTPEIQSGATETFAGNNTRADLVEKIALKKCVLTLSVPAGEDFSFLNDISIYIQAQGLPDVRIAWKENIPDNPGSVLVLETSQADIKEHIKKDKFSLRVNTTTDELITRDHQIDIESVFLVDAKILGL